MSPEQAAQLTEGLAEELWQAESLRVMGRRRSVPWSEAGPAAHAQWRPLAAAAMAYSQAVSHGTGITRVTVDGVEQVDLEDYQRLPLSS